MNLIKKLLGGDSQTKVAPTDTSKVATPAVTNETELFLEWLRCEAETVDLDSSANEEPGKFQLCLFSRFEYDVRKGGFAQFLFNLGGNHLSEVEDMLIASSADVAQDFYVQALRACLENDAEYQRFLASNYTDPSPLKDKFHAITLAYCARNKPLVEEGAFFLAAGLARYKS